MGFKKKIFRGLTDSIVSRCDEKFFARLGQTATELAIFGAILIFVLGLIIRYAVNFNYTQNQSYEAMRLAMQQSFLASESSKNASRNVASILFIEDRKDPDVSSDAGGKYGAQTRSPFIVGGSGTMSKNLFMFTDWGHPEDLPIMDVFINGKHFTFTTTAFRSYDLMVRNASGVWEPNFYPGSTTRRYDFIPATAPNGPCFTVNGVGQPCVVLYTRITRSYKYGTFCTDNISCPANPLADCCNRRFNLDRDTSTQCGGCSDGADVPYNPDITLNKRATFAWQWYPVKAVAPQNIDISKGKNVSLDVDGDLKEEQVLIVRTIGNCTFDYESKVIPSGWNGMSHFFECLRGGAVRTVQVIDTQGADLDLDYSTWDADGGFTPATGPRSPVPQPGLREESRLYTFDSGSYFLIESGKLYNGNQYIRNTNRKDKVDMIERMIQLSNDTGRMYDGSNPDVETSCGGGATDTCGSWQSSCCYGANTFRTCFDRTCKILFVRSNIADRTGRKWITNVSTDKNPLISR